MSTGLFAQQMGEPDNKLRIETVKNILQLAAGAAGLGAASRGISGLKDMWDDATSPPPKLPVRQQVIRVPIKSASTGPYVKLANQMLACVAREKVAVDPSGLENGIGHVLNSVGLMRNPDNSNWSPLWDRFANQGAKSVKDMPWAQIAAVPAVAGAGYLGWKGIDSLIGVSRGKEQDSELDAAKKRYEQALAGKAASLNSYKCPSCGAEDEVEPEAMPGTCPKCGEKMASAIPVLLDRLAEKRAAEGFEKKADFGHQMLGAMGVAMLGTGVASGVAAYNWTRRNAADKILEEALRRRQERIYAAGPPPIFAVPEMPGEKRDKAANIGAAADKVLGNMEAERQAVQQRTAAILGIGQDKKPAPAPKPGPPQLPSVAHNIPQ